MKTKPPAVMRKPIAVVVGPSVYNALVAKAVASDVPLSKVCEDILTGAILAEIEGRQLREAAE